MNFNLKNSIRPQLRIKVRDGYGQPVVKLKGDKDKIKNVLEELERKYG